MKVSRVLWVLIAALALLSPLGFWACRSGMEAKAQAAMREELDRLLREARGRSGERPVLRGAPQPGKAWERYLAATRAAPDEEELMRKTLREGAARSDGQRAREWEKPEAGVRIGFAEVLLKKALSLCRSEDPVQAPELWLDLLQFFADFARNSSREDWEATERHREEALFGLTLSVRTVALNKDEQGRIGRELELLDRGFPSLRDLLVNSAMSQGCMYADFAKTKPLLPEEEKPSWRHLYSERIAISSAFLAEVDCLRRIGETESLPWLEAVAAAEEAKTELKPSTNPILLRYARHSAEQAASAARAFRVHRARLRLLRIAFAWRADGTLLDLEDPFGGTLRREADGRGFKAWSRGVDGKDDGGQGDWISPDRPDIVLEVPK